MSSWCSVSAKYQVPSARCQVGARCNYASCIVSEWNVRLFYNVPTPEVSVKHELDSGSCSSKSKCHVCSMRLQNTSLKLEEIDHAPFSLV